jgi:hypothetical protein
MSMVQSATSLPNMERCYPGMGIPLEPALPIQLCKPYNHDALIFNTTTSHHPLQRWDLLGRCAWVVISTAAGIRRRDDAARRRSRNEKGKRRRRSRTVWIRSGRVGGDWSERVVEHADGRRREEREKEMGGGGGTVASLRRNQAEDIYTI